VNLAPQTRGVNRAIRRSLERAEIHASRLYRSSRRGLGAEHSTIGGSIGLALKDPIGCAIVCNIIFNECNDDCTRATGVDVPACRRGCIFVYNVCVTGCGMTPL